MKKSIQKVLMAAFVLAATLMLAPSVDAKAYGITQINPAKDSITVTWTAEPDATNYKVYVGESYSDAVLYAVLPATATQYTISGLPAGCEKYVAVKYTYQSSSGNTYEYNVGSDYDLRTVPAKVTGVKQEKWWYFIKQFDVIWDDVESADSYEWIVYNNSGKKLKSGTATGNRFTYSKKVSNTMVYKVKVRAKSTICGKTYTTPWSSYGYFFTQPRVKSVKATNGKLTIKWDKISGATGYEVFVSTKKTTGYKKVKTVSKSKSSVTIKKFKSSKIKKSKKYYVFVKAIKKVGSRKYTSGKLYYWNSKNSSYGYF
ncbi:MAG: hypothetical protein E7289_07555 [Lachnospiraceae bacterium]|nr:hypothetical protein [Lachnospiraceae bacterium]